MKQRRIYTEKKVHPTLQCTFFCYVLYLTKLTYLDRPNRPKLPAQTLEMTEKYKCLLPFPQQSQD
jgi:hypothetical protein